MNKFTIIMLIIVVSLCLSSCATVPLDTAQTTSEGITYELFYIEGMPCMRIGRVALGNNTVWSYDGITCDWSKWNGYK